MDFKTFTYEFKPDNDYYNKKFTDKWNGIYGSRVVSVDNDFLTQEKKYTSLFSPTPLCDEPSSDRVIPRIFDVDSSNQIKHKPSNLRILFYGGVKNTGVAWTYYNDNPATSTTETTYPYCGHLDDVTNPTFDLNFGAPRELFYKANE